MKRFSEQLNKKSKSVKLQVVEKQELRERLVSYMEYHPLPAEMRSEKKVVKNIDLSTEAFKTFSIPFTSIFKTSAAIAVMVLVVIPFAAEKSVPGDTLYAIKVEFNEELKSSLTFDSYEKIEWETERLNRRIAEARLLESEGKLTEQVEAEVADAVRQHTANAQREIEELRTEDADAATIASISLDATLEVQATSLQNERDAVLTEKGEGGKINVIAAAIEESRVTAEEPTASSTLPSYDKIMAKVEQNTTRIYELVSTLESVVSTEDFSEVNRRAEDINRALQVVVEITEKESETTKAQLIGVLQQTQRLVVYLTQLEVIKTVDIETLIPIVLTNEEEKVKLTEVNSEIEQKVKRIDLLLEQTDDEDLLEKVIPAREDIGSRLDLIATSTLEYESYVVLTKDVLELVNDVLNLLEQKVQLEKEVVVKEDSLEENSTSTEPVIKEVEVATSTEEVLEETITSEEYMEEADSESIVETETI
jgi:hypothetical protein